MPGKNVGIDILVTFRNSGTRIVQPIKMIEWTSHENKEFELLQSVQINIHESNTCRKGWLYFDVHGKQPLYFQQSYIPVSAAYPTYLSSSFEDVSLDMITVFHTRAYG